MAAMLKRLGLAILLFFGLLISIGVFNTAAEAAGLRQDGPGRIVSWGLMLLALAFSLYMVFSERGRKALAGTFLVVYGLGLSLFVVTDVAVFLTTGVWPAEPMPGYVQPTPIVCIGSLFLFGVGLFLGGVGTLKSRGEA